MWIAVLLSSSLAGQELPTPGPGSERESESVAVVATSAVLPIALPAAPPTAAPVAVPTAAPAAVPTATPTAAPAPAPSVTTTAPTTPTAAPPPMWGAGVGLTGFFVGDGTLGAVAVSIERRLVDNLWLVARANAAVTSVRDQIDTGGFSGVEKSLISRAGVDGGARWVLADGPVRPSVHAVAGVSLAQRNEESSAPFLEGDGDLVTREREVVSRELRAGVVGGFALDVPFVDVLALRLATDVAAVEGRLGTSQDVSAAAEEDGAAAQKTSSQSLSASVFLLPSIELRVFF